MFIRSCPSLIFTKNYSRSAFLARSDRRSIAPQSIGKYIIIMQWNIGSVVVIITAQHKQWGRRPQQDHRHASRQGQSQDLQQCQTEQKQPLLCSSITRWWRMLTLFSSLGSQCQSQLFGNLGYCSSEVQQGFQKPQIVATTTLY